MVLVVRRFGIGTTVYEMLSIPAMLTDRERLSPVGNCTASCARFIKSISSFNPPNRLPQIQKPKIINIEVR